MFAVFQRAILLTILLSHTGCFLSRGLLQTPSTIRILRESSTSFRATWDAFTNPNFGSVRLAYELSSRTVSCTSPHAEVSPTATEVTLTGLTANTTYNLLLCVVGRGGDTYEAVRSETLTTAPECDTSLIATGSANFTTISNQLSLTDANGDGKKVLCLMPNDDFNIDFTATEDAGESQISLTTSDFMIFAPSSSAATIAATRTDMGATEHTAFRITAARVVLENVIITTAGSSGYGINMNGGTSAELRNVRITTSGSAGHGIFFSSASSISTLKSVTIRRASGASGNAIAIFVSNAASSISTSGVTQVRVCSLGSNEWEDHSACVGTANRCGLLANSGPTIPSTHTPYTGSQTGAGTFPFVAPLAVGNQNGFDDIILGGTCPNY